MGLSALKTKDLFLSAYLLSHEIYLQNIEIEDRERVVFSFLDTSKLDELNREYHEGKAVCNVHRLKESLQYLKDQMFSLLRRVNHPCPSLSKDGSLKIEERRYEHIKRGDRGR